MLAADAVGQARKGSKRNHKAAQHCPSRVESG
jgi:hypothetical protein